MNTEESVGSALPENQASGQTPSIEKDSVAYETYRRVVGNEKKLKSELSVLREEVERFRQEKLQAEGNNTEVIESLRKQNKELDEKLKKTTNNFGWKIVSSEIKSVAAKEGCTNPDKLLKLIDDEDYKTLPVGDDFSVDTDAIKALIEKAKVQNADIGLFKTTKAAPVDGVPNSRPQKIDKVDLNKLSAADLKALYKQTRE